MKNKIICLVAAALYATATVIGAIALSSNPSLDIIKRESIKSFDELLKVMENNIEADEVNSGWSLSALDDTARFIWSVNLSETPKYDVMLELDATPFFNAGLDKEKLPHGYELTSENKVLVGTSSSNNDYERQATPLQEFEEIVNLNRNVINYHSEHDHFSIDKIGGHNGFAWANNLSGNEKDIEFSLDASLLIEAGVDSEKVEGWTFANVTSSHGSRSNKFVKSFDVK